MSIKKVKPQPRYVHIHAVCPYFEIFEQVLESKSVSRLLAIKGMYEHEAMRQKTMTRISKRNNMIATKEDVSLSVKTVIVNPTLF